MLVDLDRMMCDDHAGNLGWSRKLTFGFQKPRRKFNYQTPFFPPKFQFCPNIRDMNFPLVGMVVSLSIRLSLAKGQEKDFNFILSP